MEWQSLVYGIMETVIYSLVGIILMGMGFLIVKVLCPFSMKKEIEDDQNISLGIIIGSIIIGVAIIVAAVINTPTSASKTGRQLAPKYHTGCPYYDRLQKEQAEKTPIDTKTKK